MITKGIIEPISNTIVNLVNADYIVKQKGLRISEERVVLDSSHDESIQIQISHVESKFASAVSESGQISIDGKVKYGTPHLTCVGSFGVDVSLEGNLILCRQIDQPGMFGLVGNILASQLNFKAEKPMGFDLVLFSSSHQAIAAKDILLQYMLFDPESKSVLHTEMAMKNLFVKRGIGADAGAFDQSKRLRTAGGL
ncbi:D-3-phosphoglycerate dehydrogenase 2, chloroplastic [Trifolium repens]|nr:D-3-phosphoglycerate dehydrogenase 2, chloroplastic [Trifolium repens]